MHTSFILKAPKSDLKSIVSKGHRDLIFLKSWEWLPGWELSTYQGQGLYSLSRKTSYRKISWRLEVARFGFRLFQLLWDLTGTSAATLPRCLSNFSAKRSLQHSISRLRDFTRFGGKTSYRLVNRGPEDAYVCWPVICAIIALDNAWSAPSHYHIIYTRDCEFDPWKQIKPQQF